MSIPIFLCWAFQVTVRDMFEEICQIRLSDDVTFSLQSIGEILL